MPGVVRGFLAAVGDDGHVIAVGRLPSMDDPVIPQWYECYRGAASALPDTIPLADIEYQEGGRLA
jgi:hypothetical protein